ncbi:sigma-70 family RNA polymerase sigma factor [Tamlana fucoidanivorans]|uniref:Sigma-70 family RNA polymerase sigma factor n=1 Tax=Allotamlana fucoidanivorans TaxID=2583814 RepID=A0A5C4SEX7_9FLAO|nr:sigma-70 family RNA polymerase sigma factor [Tamlana fucoidanivorans]TNJ42156.1 sigma-70 family RNA polymerase sigma factor [Tamlana fucoidanivorans]
MRKKQQLVDKQLIIEYQSGHVKALPVLVKRWHKTFCEKAYWITKDADVAKDIAQESWTTIITKLPHLKKAESFGSWALRIVYTKSLDFINETQRINKNKEVFKVSEKTKLLEDQEVDLILKQRLIHVINELPETQQAVIKLFYVQEYSIKEIGDILNVSVGTVKSRLFTAREKLKEVLIKNKNYEN